MAIRGIRSVAIDVCDIEGAAKFYTSVWNLAVVSSSGDEAHFRGTEADHPILSLHRAAVPAMRRIDFDVASDAGVDALHARVAAAVVTTEKPHKIASSGAYGFGFKDNEGRNFAIIASQSKEQPSSPDRPTKVSHVNLNAGDYDGTTKFMTEVLGFRLIDETVRARFLHADCGDHFSLALVKHRNATLNHIAFEMPDLDSTMRGAGRMRDAGYPIEWGVGRHGPGDNVFAYFAGPEEIPLEYTAEMLQIDAGYKSRSPEEWKFPPGRSDQWGITAPQTPRLARIQELFRFTADGYRT